MRVLAIGSDARTRQPVEKCRADALHIIGVRPPRASAASSASRVTRGCPCRPAERQDQRGAGVRRGRRPGQDGRARHRTSRSTATSSPGSRASAAWSAALGGITLRRGRGPQERRRLPAIVKPGTNRLDGNARAGASPGSASTCPTATSAAPPTRGADQGRHGDGAARPGPARLARLLSKMGPHLSDRPHRRRGAQPVAPASTCRNAGQGAHHRCARLGRHPRGPVGRPARRPGQVDVPRPQGRPAECLTPGRRPGRPHRRHPADPRASSVRSPSRGCWCPRTPSPTTSRSSSSAWPRSTGSSSAVAPCTSCGRTSPRSAPSPSRPQRHGHGVGSAILTALMADARALGVQRLFCLTFEVDFFTRHGFDGDRGPGRRARGLRRAGPLLRRGCRGVPRPRTGQAEHLGQHQDAAHALSGPRSSDRRVHAQAIARSRVVGDATPS